MTRSRYSAALVVTVLAGTFGIAVPAGAVATMLFYASNDSYVDLSAPNTNFDTANVLTVAGGPTRMSYVSFVVTGLTEPVTHARLRMHTRDASYAGSPTGGTVQQTTNNWVETSLRADNRPAPVGAALSLFGQVRPNGWYEADVTPAVTGNMIVSFRISSTNPDGAYYDSRENFPYGPQLIVDTGPPGSNGNVLLAAGDIATCDRDLDEQTARLLDREPGTVAAVGDTVYETGTAAEFANCYDPTWGRHKARTRPAVGNHEYLTPNAAGYFGYFGAAAGDPDKGYYSYDLADGRWHVVVLNSNCSRVGGCHVGSPQEQWLRADLAANPTRCTLAYWHHPVFSSGERQRPEVLPLFQALYDNHAEIVISGHAHQYERFAPQTPTRAAAPLRGIRQFVVGTGGRSLQQDFGTVVPNSEVRNGTTYGVLRLTLLEDGYQWRFLPVLGQTFSDAGTDICQ